MKKTKKITIIISLCIVLLFAAVIHTVIHGNDKYYKSFNFQNSDSITLVSLDGNMEVEISDGNEKDFIESFCSCSNAYSDEVETPACFFDTVEIRIKKGGKTYSIYPTPDGCDNISINTSGKNYYHQFNGNLDEFVKIVRKHGFKWTW